MHAHYNAIEVTAQARWGSSTNAALCRPFGSTSAMVHDIEFDDQLEMEERERCLLDIEEQERALQAEAHFIDEKDANAEPFGSPTASSSSAGLLNPSSASSSQSPAPVSTPVSTTSTSSCQRTAELDSCAEEQPPCKRSMCFDSDTGRTEQSAPAADERVVRRRLRGKQARPELPVQEQPHEVRRCDAVDPWWSDFGDENSLKNLSPSSRYHKCYYKLRIWFFSSRDEFEKLLKSHTSIGTACLKAITGWRQLPKWNKRMVLDHYLTSNNAPQWIREVHTLVWPELDANQTATPEVKRFQGKSILFTYIGEWGLLPDIKVALADSDEMVRPWKRVVDELRATKKVQDLWAEFEQHCQKLSRFLSDITWVCCMELCMETFRKERRVRLHGHVFLRRATSKMEFHDTMDIIMFREGAPCVSERLGGASRSVAASWQGAFYCQCPKIGGLFSSGNISPFTGYPVNGDWVFNLVQQDKIEYDDAKELIVRSGRGLARRLQDLNTWRTARTEITSRDYIVAAQRQHEASNSPWRVIELVDKWKEKNTQPMMRRKKILVLVGPTGTGKTEYVKALFGPQHVLELNAAGMLHPCLRQFDPDVHRCILWDEAEAILIAQNRKLFQCPAAFVELGFSPGGHLTYPVMVSKAVMVVCTNRWDEQLEMLAPGDRKWIEGNSVVVRVATPLWCQASTSSGEDNGQSPAPTTLTPCSSHQSPSPEKVSKQIPENPDQKLVFI